jgi:hypothetical protein
MMEQLVNLITTSGMAVVIVAYFLYKDYKFHDTILDVLCELKEVMSVIKTKVGIDNDTQS